MRPRASWAQTLCAQYARACHGVSVKGEYCGTLHECALWCPHPEGDSVPAQGAVEREMSKSRRSLDRAAHGGWQAAHQRGAKVPVGGLAIPTKHFAATARNLATNADRPLAWASLGVSNSCNAVGLATCSCPGPSLADNDREPGQEPIRPLMGLAAAASPSLDGGHRRTRSSAPHA